jgi:putative ABC transport system permease protein
MRTLWQDIRFGLRIMRNAPGFTAVAALALALGIGVNTTILSAVNGFVIRPLPVDKPDELVAPFMGSKKEPQVWGWFSYPNYMDFRQQNKSLSGLLAWTMTSAGISASDGSHSGDGGRAEVAWGELVSDNYFEVLGVKPVLGRGFLPEEDRTPNTHPVVVLSHSLWRQRFNADPGIVGRTIYMNGSPFTVIGVAPATFKGVKFAFPQSFWVPLMMSAKIGLNGDWVNNRAWGRFTLIGRLKPGVTREQAEADLNLVAENLAKLYPNSNADTKVQVASEMDARFGDLSGWLKFSSLIALCVAGLALLVVCANVANLMLARAAARSKEIGIRLAIGAGRLRIMRQLLTESVLLSLLGGALGWVFAFWGADLVQASFPRTQYPIDLDVNPDLYVFKWMLAVSLLTGVIFGLAPAWWASRPDLVAVIKGDAAGKSHGKWRWNLSGALVVAQVAISVVVLICAGLFLRSLNKAFNLDPGFSADNLVTMTLDPGSLGYDEAAGKRFYTEALRRVESLTGVRAASLAGFLPLGNDNSLQGPVLKEGEPDPGPGKGISIYCNWVAPNYFTAVKTSLVMGRDFTDRDKSDAPRVVIVNQEFARKFYGGEHNALGKRIRLWWSGGPLMEIVGIAKDGLYISLYEDPRPYMFLPVYQLYNQSMTLLVSANSAGDLKAVAEGARREITRLDGRVPVFGVFMAEQNMSYAYWNHRLAAGMASVFGLLVLLLATMGLYSVMSYVVSQRTREIGIRMALGAQVRDVLKLVLRQGLKLVLLGVALGTAASLLATRLVKSLLLGVSATDPLTFVAIAALLTLVAMLACWIPARRAAKVDPMVALRTE